MGPPVILPTTARDTRVTSTSQPAPRGRACLLSSLCPRNRPPPTLRCRAAATLRSLEWPPSRIPDRATLSYTGPRRPPIHTPIHSPRIDTAREPPLASHPSRRRVSSRRHRVNPYEPPIPPLLPPTVLLNHPSASHPR